MRTEYDDIVRYAMHKGNAFLKTAAEHISDRTEEMRNDQYYLDSILKERNDNGTLDDMSGESLQRKILAYIARERKIFQEFDMTRKFNSTTRVPEPINNHKMSLLLDRVYTEFAADESNVINLFSGRFTPEPSFYALWPTLRTDTYWGSTRGIMHSVKLICADFATSDTTCANYLNTSILHATPWADLTPSFIKANSKFCASINGIPAFGFVHGGYAFGGQRAEAQQKLFGPEDCSSMLANWIYKAKNPSSTASAPNQFNTVHQLYWWRSQQTGQHMLIDANLYTPQMAQYNTAIYEYAYKGHEQLQKLKGGDIFLLRSFAKTSGNPDLQTSGGGHTGLVLARDPEVANNVLVFECARDIESENPQQGKWGPAGCGIGSFSAEYEHTSDSRIKRTMFLALKS